MTNWLFQGNPKTYQIDAYLSSHVGKQIVWAVNQRHYRHEMQGDDEVFIWRADGWRPGTGGVVGWGVIAVPPTMLPDDAPELWEHRAKAATALRVVITLKEVRLTAAAGMLTRAQIKTQPGLTDLAILRMAQHTNYRLEPEQAAILWAMWQEGMQ